MPTDVERRSPDRHSPEVLLLAGAVGASDDPFWLSLAANLLERGVYFVCDEQQDLPVEWPADLSGLRAILVSADAWAALWRSGAEARARVEAFLRGGGYLQVVAPPAGAAGLDGYYRNVLYDVDNQHRVMTLLGRAPKLGLFPAGLRQRQESRSAAALLAPIRRQLLAYLARPRPFNEYQLHWGKTAAALAARGDEEVAAAYAAFIRGVFDGPYRPRHHDHLGALFGAAWLARERNDHSALEAARGPLDAYLRGGLRVDGVHAGSTTWDEQPRVLNEPAAPEAAAGAFPHPGAGRMLWTETLHMQAGPLAAFARAAGDTRYLDEALRLAEALRAGLIRPDGLFMHAGEDGRARGGAWGRGQTHALYGLLYILEELPPGHPAHPVLVRVLDDVGRALRRYQDADTGLWRNLVPHPDARVESSATCGIVVVYAHCVRAGWLPRADYLKMLQRAWRGLRWMYWRGGLGAQCRGSFIAPDAAYYLGRPQGWAWVPQFAQALRDMSAIEQTDPRRAS
ncbi:MAG: glycoside hydrolase family 88 protein [Candidatus Marinimicrobia bacterium]|nr:glycoside hydrolase family 88 protein [Candidatus Neomarinimicrobiota bacterium]